MGEISSFLSSQNLKIQRKHTSIINNYVVLQNLFTSQHFINSAVLANYKMVSTAFSVERAENKMGGGAEVKRKKKNYTVRSTSRFN